MEDDDKEQRNLGLFFGMVFMSKCLEMWVFGKNITKGMSVEIEKAQQRGMKIRYFTDRCEEVPENERA
jgi:phosphoribulokinase